MTRKWLSCRLSGPEWADPGSGQGPGLPALVSDLVSDLRQADAGGSWLFRRLRTGGDPELGIWFHATPGTLRELAECARAESAPRAARLTAEVSDEHHAAGRDSFRTEAADALSIASSEFALDIIREGGFTPERQLSLAVLHLRRLVGLVPAGDRLAFLFLCWQHWTADLSAEERIGLGIQVSLGADAALEAAGEFRMSEAADRSWQTYHRAVHALAAEQAEDDSAPINYLLFEHAHLTHSRLGIPAAVEALAARLVRAELAEARTTPLPRRDVAPSKPALELQYA